VVVNVSYVEVCFVHLMEVQHMVDLV